VVNPVVRPNTEKVMWNRIGGPAFLVTIGVFTARLSLPEPPTLEFAVILNARQPRMEKPGPYCFIGGLP
jgi:hypothetical protein